MSNNNQTYNAKVIRDKMQGVSTPTIDEIVEEIMVNGNGLLKKEEIDKAVGLKIKLSVDDSINSAVSAALKKLEAEGKVSHPKQGYWV